MNNLLYAASDLVDHRKFQMICLLVDIKNTDQIDSAWYLITGWCFKIPEIIEHSLGISCLRYHKSRCRDLITWNIINIHFIGWSGKVDIYAILLNSGIRKYFKITILECVFNIGDTFFNIWLWDIQVDIFYLSIKTLYYSLIELLKLKDDLFNLKKNMEKKDKLC